MASPRFPARSRFVERIEAMSTRPPTLGAAVEDAVSLAMGEPFGGTPDAVVHAAVRALRSGRTRYEQLRGSPRLRDSVAAHLSGYAGSALVASHVVLAPGASAGLAATILALVIPGDKVVLPEPTYSLYADHVSMAGGHVEWMRTAEDGRLPLENLEDALQDDPHDATCLPGSHRRLRPRGQPHVAIRNEHRQARRCPGRRRQGVHRRRSLGCVLTLYAQKRGIAGIVIDGSVHDSQDIVAMNLPAVSRAVCIKGTDKVNPGEVNMLIMCGGVLVSPGDVVVGDADGVTVVPAALVSEAVKLADARERKEAEFRAALELGESPVGLMGLRAKLGELGFPRPRLTQGLTRHLTAPTPPPSSEGQS